VSVIFLAVDMEKIAHL